MEYGLNSAMEKMHVLFNLTMEVSRALPVVSAGCGLCIKPDGNPSGLNSS